MLQCWCGVYLALRSRPSTVAMSAFSALRHSRSWRHPLTSIAVALAAAAGKQSADQRRNAVSPRPATSRQWYADQRRMGHGKFLAR